MTRPDAGYELLIARTFEAPRDVVYSIWTDIEHVRKWWGPKAFTATLAEWDFRVGGAYRIAITSERYGENWMGGRFIDIVANRRIVFTFAWEGANDSIGNETLVTVTFEEEGGKTTQSFHQTPFQNTDTRDSHVGGWNEVFDREQGYAEDVAKNK